MSQSWRSFKPHPIGLFLAAVKDYFCCRVLVKPIGKSAFSPTRENDESVYAPWI